MTSEFWKGVRWTLGTLILMLGATIGIIWVTAVRCAPHDVACYCPVDDQCLP